MSNQEVPEVAPQEPQVPAEENNALVVQENPGVLAKVWNWLMPVREQAAQQVEQQLNDENVQEVFDRVVMPTIRKAGFAMRDALRNVLVELLTEAARPRLPALEGPQIEPVEEEEPAPSPN